MESETSLVLPANKLLITKTREMK